MKLLKQGGFIHRIMCAIYDLIILNFLWVITSIPIITIGASTTSLFYCVGKIVRGEDLNLLKDYINSFKLNFKQGTLIWSVLLIIYMIIYTNITFFSEIPMSWARVIAYLQLPILVIVVFTTLLIFPILSRFSSSTIHIFRVSLILGVRHSFLCIICFIIFTIGVILIRYIPALMLFMLSSLIAFGIYVVLNRVLERYNPQNSVM